jgi:hypothetical protein
MIINNRNYTGIINQLLLGGKEIPLFLKYNMNNPFDMMKSMKDLQSNMDEMKAKLETTFATGNAGAGMVVITINGKYKITDIKIDSAIVDPTDVDTLQVLIAAAFNSASQNLQDKLQQESTKMAGSLGNLFGQN